MQTYIKFITSTSVSILGSLILMFFPKKIQHGRECRSTTKVLWSIQWSLIIFSYNDFLKAHILLKRVVNKNIKGIIVQNALKSLTSKAHPRVG